MISMLQCGMFHHAKCFNQNISSWDVSSGVKYVSCTTIVGMLFLKCNIFNKKVAVHN